MTTIEKLYEWTSPTGQVSGGYTLSEVLEKIKNEGGTYRLTCDAI